VGWDPKAAWFREGSVNDVGAFQDPVEVRLVDVGRETPIVETNAHLPSPKAAAMNRLAGDACEESPAPVGQHVASDLGRHAIAEPQTRNDEPSAIVDERGLYGDDVTGTSRGVGQGSTVRPRTDDCQGESRHD
jgi:hypothetical protein